jgi:hypothetical protein
MEAMPVLMFFKAVLIIIWWAEHQGLPDLGELIAGKPARAEGPVSMTCDGTETA